MTKKKKAFKTRLGILFALIFIVSLALPINTHLRPFRAKAQSIVSISSLNGTKVATPDREGLVWFSIQAEAGLYENIVVYYRTVNQTAIGGIDFDEIPTVYGRTKSDVKGRVTLSNANFFTEIFSLQTNLATFATVDNSTNEKHTPQFAIEIYKIECDGVATDVDDSSLTCVLGSEHDLTYQVNSGNYTFTEYLKGDSTSPYYSKVSDYALKDDPEKGKYNYLYKTFSMSNKAKQNIWENDYIATGIANGYLSFDTLLSGNDDNDCVKMTLSNDFSYEGYKPYTGNSSYSVKTYNFNSVFGVNEIYPRSNLETFDGFYQPKAMLGYTYEDIADFYARYLDYIGFSHSYLDYEQVIRNAVKKNATDLPSRYKYYSDFLTHGIQYKEGNYVVFDRNLGGFTYNLADTDNYSQNGVWNITGGIGNLFNEEFLNQEYYKNIESLASLLIGSMYNAIEEIATKIPESLYNDEWGYGKGIVEAHNKGFEFLYPNRLYYEIPKGGLDICMKAETKASWDTAYEGLTFYYLLQDKIAPVVSGVYSTDRENDTLISVRFKEPVYIKNNKASSIKIKCLLNGYTDKYVYAPLYNFSTPNGTSNGSYTDTLTFRLDKSTITEDMNVTNLKISEIIGADGILDFSYYGYSPLQTVTKNNTVNCLYDNRIPSVEKIVPDTNSAGYSHTINVSLKNCSDGAKLLYAFVPTEELPEAYKNSTTAPIGAINAEFESVNILGGTKPSVSVTASNLNGNYSLVVYAQSGIGRFSDNLTVYKNIIFDNVAPVLSNIADDGGTEIHTFTFDYLEEISGLKEVYFLYSSEPWTNKNDFNGQVFKIAGTKNNGVFTTNTVSYQEVGVKSGETKAFYVGFYAVDNSLNVSEYFPISSPLKFSSSTSFEVKTNDLVKIADNKFIKDRASNVSVTFGYELPSALMTPEKFYLESICKLKTDDSEVDRYILEDAKLPSETNKDPIVITSGIADMTESGAYVLTFRAKFQNIDDLRVCKTYVYVYSNNDLPSVNYLNASTSYGLITNYFSLSQEAQFVYKDANGVSQEVYYSSKNNENKIGLETVFSSEASAINYVKFVEMQDLKLLSITSSNMASFNSQVGYIKADTSQIKAEVGDYWIAYKRSTWERNSTSSWVYYYYGKGSTYSKLSVNLLPRDLVSAIDFVSTRIVNQYGVYKYVHENDGNYLTLDEYGSPYFAQNQIHSKGEYATVNRVGDAYDEESRPTYDGDGAIYDNLLEFSGYDYIVATNYEFVFTDNNVITYKKSDELDYKILNSKTLSELTDGGEAYDILEYSELGCFKYRIFVDRQTPTVDVSYVEGVGENKTLTLNAEEHNNESIYATEFYINALNDFADSTYSYVTVFKRNGTHVLTKLMAELESSHIDFSEFGYTEGGYIVEIRDRSGNAFSFEVFVNSTELSANVKTVENSGITFSVSNRSLYEIEVYEVRRNGILVSSSFEESRKFTQSGTYTFKLIDKYGNAWKDNGVAFEFTRNEPNITWRYYDNGGIIDYVAGKDGQAVAITSEDNGQYTIYTSKQLQLVYPTSSGYEIEFLNDFQEGRDYTVSSMIIGGMNNIVEFKKISSFRLKIYYKDYPNVYSIYTCVVDNNAPSIIVSYQTTNYTGNEQTYFSQNIDDLPNGFIPENIGYSENGKTTRYVVNGNTVFADKLNFSFSEATGIRYVTVKYNGEVFRTLTPADNLSFSMNRYGDYEIIACDIVNNVSRLTFRNDKHEFTEIKVDGTNELYGNDNATVLLTEAMEVRFFVNHEDFVIYKYDGTNLYELTYVSQKDENGITGLGLKISEPIFLSNLVEKGKWFKISEKGFYAKTDSNGNVVIKYLLSLEKTDETEIEIRATSSIVSLPVYKTVYLCGQKTDLELFNSKGAKIVTNQKELTVSSNKGFIVNEIPESVLSVKVAYSNTDNFTDFEDLVINQLYNANGRYKIVIENKYHNVLNYYLVLSDSFLVTVETESSGGFTNSFSMDYKGEYGGYCSSGTFKITAYSKDVTFTVYRSGSGAYAVVPVQTENGDTYIILNKNGEYDVEITDNCNNKWTAFCWKSARGVKIPEGLVTGYNEKAKEGYTNTTLSIDGSKFGDIRYVAVIKGENRKVVYDKISEHKIVDENNLKSLIGEFGDGEYVLEFRDIFGNRATLTVNYKETSTLTLSRITRTSIDEENISLCGIEQNGLWSNNQFSIQGSQLATFTVNGKSVDGTTFVGRFTSTTKDGEQSFSVYYLDEYGFEYNFTANLFRKEKEIIIPESLKVTEVGGIVTTKKDLFVTFEDANGYYVLNDGAPVPYVSGTLLKADGIYRFTIVDKAGNTTSSIVKKDTFVEYEIREVSSGRACINGEVLGTNRAVFEPINDDTARILKATLNGKETDVTDTFSGNGKWELLVVDEVGNRSYFCFYMIYHEVNSFDYRTPYGYGIDEVWHTVGETKVNLKSEVILSEDGDYSNITFTAPGVYSVVMSNAVGDVLNFGITVETEKPKAKLEGVEENGITLDNVQIKGLKEHDTVYIYKDGKLIETVAVNSSKESPVISKSGNYKIVVESRAGNISELHFVKKYVPNVAGSILIMLVISLSSIALFIGMIYRTKIKVDR